MAKAVVAISSYSAISGALAMAAYNCATDGGIHFGSVVSIDPAQRVDQIRATIVSDAIANISGSFGGPALVDTDIVVLGLFRPGQKEVLGSAVLVADAITLGPLTIPARDFINIDILVNGFDIADIATLQFNSDAGANYSSRYLSAAAGGVTWVNNPTTSATRAKLFHATTLTPKVHFIAMINRLATSKSGWQNVYVAGGNAASTPAIVIGGFEWVNTAAQITSITLLTDSGNKLLAGSGFAVSGGNF